ncbi:hypothetical protein SAMN05216304_109148 [Bosea sp. OK403]|uniref:hypothetical protein n=1 Tax=Bosea sp. OK403 TaxID=1855286 RepID=UPI0008E4BFDF|nr:hypothetical protein [Bosea sp. OK403]SFJ55019.1 hypothetical protein SAMN05216304_109148 [Bosea sp. OK403]
MTSQTTFHFTPDGYSPNLALATGYVMMEWAMIEESVTGLLRSFLNLSSDDPSQFPYVFERQAPKLTEYVKALYANYPAEFAEYERLLSEVLAVKAKRDCIAHGIPGKFTRFNKTKEVLWLPNWLRLDKQPEYVPATYLSIRQLAERAGRLKQEWYWAARTIGSVLFVAHQAKRVASGLDAAPQPPIDSLLLNPLRNPKPVKQPQPAGSALRWAPDDALWQSASLPEAPKGAVLQVVRAEILGPIEIGAAPEPSRA